MRLVDDIRPELALATEERAELWRELGRERNPAAGVEIARLTARIDELWRELRIAQVRERHGSPEPILRRAEIDRRLEREIDRRVAAARKAA